MDTDNYLILFGDLIGSTEVASEASPDIFSKLYIGSFHLAVECAKVFLERDDVFPEVPFLKTLEEIKISGDEVLSFSNISYVTAAEKVDLIASAVTFAFVLKVFWMASPYNLFRLSERKFPRDIAVGIHTGPAERIFDNKDDLIAGLHINVAKRLETLARSGSHSQIFVSDDIEYSFAGWLEEPRTLDIKKSPPILFTCFEPVRTPLNLKGIPVKVSPFELRMDLKNEKPKELFNLIKETPNEPDAQAERAAGILEETLFITMSKFTSLLEKIKDLKDPRKYIDCWFSSIDSIPHLFFSDLWTEMVGFFISCGFVRHEGLDKAKRAEYEDVTKNIYEKLLDSIERSRKRDKYFLMARE